MEQVTSQQEACDLIANLQKKLAKKANTSIRNFLTFVVDENGMLVLKSNLYSLTLYQGDGGEKIETRLEGKTIEESCNKFLAHFKAGGYATLEKDEYEEQAYALFTYSAKKGWEVKEFFRRPYPRGMIVEDY